MTLPGSRRFTRLNEDETYMDGLKNPFASVLPGH